MIHVSISGKGILVEWMGQSAHSGCKFRKLLQYWLIATINLTCISCLRMGPAAIKDKLPVSVDLILITDWYQSSYWFASGFRPLYFIVWGIQTLWGMSILLMRTQRSSEQLWAVKWYSFTSRYYSCFGSLKVHGLPTLKRHTMYWLRVVLITVACPWSNWIYFRKRIYLQDQLVDWSAACWLIVLFCTLGQF